MAHHAAMNHGVPTSSSGGVFLVKCSDCRCLAVRGGDGRWHAFYDGSALPEDTVAVVAVPVELILPFLPEIKRVHLCPAPASNQK